MAKIPEKVVVGAQTLADRDPVLAIAFEQFGPPELRRRRTRTPFAELARMICYQQLAGRAAAAIHGRFEVLCEGSPTPESVLALSDEQLRGAGLSGAKARSIQDLAVKTLDGAVELDRIGRLSDAEVVRELTLVRGIGEWTAHMFLMGQLGRLDVWPTLDYGVRTGYSRMYSLPNAPTAKELAPLGDPHAPYRSIVACWCWRTADTVVAD